MDNIAKEVPRYSKCKLHFMVWGIYSMAIIRYHIQFFIWVVPVLENVHQKVYPVFMFSCSCKGYYCTKMAIYSSVYWYFTYHSTTFSSFEITKKEEWHFSGGVGLVPPET